MVKVNGPMMSLAASGTLADAITFATWKGRPYVRERVIPSNPKSGAQTGRRAMFKWLSQIWASLSAANQATWQTLADELVASTFNAFMRVNMQGWHNFLAAFKESTDDRGDNGSDRVLSAAAWEENRIKISSTATAPAEQWGMVIFAKEGGAVTPAVGNAIIVETDPDIVARDTFWTPPTVATWHFDSMTFSVDGALESAGGAQQAAPP